MLQRFLPSGSAAGIAHAAAILIVCVGTWQILVARDAAIRDNEQEARTLSRSLGQQAARSVETVDLVLTGIVARVEAGALSDPAQLKSVLDWRRGMVPQILNIMVLDANGEWIVDSMQAPHAPINTGDRPYFAWHRDHSEQELHIDTPVASRFSGATVIPLTRRWNRPDGSFGGVVFAAVRPECVSASKVQRRLTVTLAGRRRIRDRRADRLAPHDVSQAHRSHQPSDGATSSRDPSLKLFAQLRVPPDDH